MQSDLFIGLDLGTTNIALCYKQKGQEVRTFPIHQLQDTGLVVREPTLPAAIYLPDEGEYTQKEIALPWGSSDWIVGQMALQQASRAPHRSILSTKSWLCVDGQDRNSPILPFQSDIAERISPLEATRRLLNHVRQSWNWAFEQNEVSARLEEVELVLTIPASFDPAARELTLQAAGQAGLENITLLEEPQAALYAWLGQHGDWREKISIGEQILVVDIGGGTTDFSLIEVGGSDGNLELKRIKVGPHILLGGDNLDLALAHQAAGRLPKKPDSSQMQALTAKSREGKEILLGDGEPKSFEIVLQGGGSRLFAKSMKTALEPEDIENLLQQGFFQVVSPQSRPQEAPRLGLRQAGLPYASDPAFAHHLAAFLQSGEEGAHQPSYVLFNGSMFDSERIRSMLMNLIQPLVNSSIQSLKGRCYRTAVAVGAAEFAEILQEGGLRIRQSLPFSYYIGVEKAALAIPGVKPSLSLVCVAPKGLEEGDEARVSEGGFQLIGNQTVSFRLFRHPIREDQPGIEVDLEGEEFEEVSHIEKRMDEQQGVVPITIQASLLEIGLLKLSCQTQTEEPRTHELEFSVRSDAASRD